VTQSHGNLMRGSKVIGGYLGFTAEDRLLCPVPWSFDYGFGQLLNTLLGGVTQVLPVHSNAWGIGEAIEQFNPTVLAGTPTLFSLLTGGMSPLGQLDTSSLRLLTSSGGQVAPSVTEALRAHFPGAGLSLNYGLTETYRSCHLPMSLAGRRAGAIGQPIPGVDMLVVRPDGTPAEDGEVGELVHRGDYIMLGYWDDPEATAAALRPDPLADPDASSPAKALFTGDMGFRDEDGLFYFVGRNDHQLKSMDVKVNPAEIEAILLGLDGIVHAAVFGLEHEILGHEIWAAYVCEPGNALSAMELRKILGELISPYMLPRQYLPLEQLPNNVNGKTNYHALAELARQRMGA
jgi:acyl-CoA synthetase (AMP-forming)/AMP-acid ligase II